MTGIAEPRGSLEALELRGKSGQGWRCSRQQSAKKQEPRRFFYDPLKYANERTRQ